MAVCHSVLSDPCSLVVTCLERADLMALLCVMFPCVFVTFPYGVLDQVWYLIVLIPDCCLLTYFHRINIDENEITLHRWIHKSCQGSVPE